MKQRISFLLACVFLCLTGCRASGAEQTFFAMDTVMSVQVSGRRGPQAVAAAREAVERLDDLLSHFNLIVVIGKFFKTESSVRGKF